GTALPGTIQGRAKSKPKIWHLYSLSANVAVTARSTVQTGCKPEGNKAASLPVLVCGDTSTVPATGRTVNPETRPERMPRLFKQPHRFPDPPPVQSHCPIQPNRRLPGA